MVPLLSVRVTNNPEKTFSMFSRDQSVPQVGVCLVKIAYIDFIICVPRKNSVFKFYNFPKIVFVYPVSTYQPR